MLQPCSLRTLSPKPSPRIVRRSGDGPTVAGFLGLRGTTDQAGPRLEASLGALMRIAVSGRKPSAPVVDLAEFALIPVPLALFAERAGALFAGGGGAALLALGEIERLQKLSPQALPVFELELLEMLGARMGPRDLVSFAGPGLVALAMPGDVERLAQEACVSWHGRGPATVGALEIDRSLSVHFLSAEDLPHLEARAQLLTQGSMGALGLTGFPAPLALAASPQST